jgi:hypothetical protein
MPHVLIVHTGEELIQFAKKVSEEILRLADVAATPLMPGETVDTRRHQIAKLGKQLAEAFIAIDKFVSHIAGDAPADVTADAPPTDNKDAN